MPFPDSDASDDWSSPHFFPWHLEQELVLILSECPGCFVCPKHATQTLDSDGQATIEDLTPIACNVRFQQCQAIELLVQAGLIHLRSSGYFSPTRSI